MSAASVLVELKRRHVYKVVVVYAVAAWLLLQLGSILFPAFDAPEWSIRLLIGILVLGFPVAVILAWAFEMTPEGVRRAEPDDSPAARPTRHAHRIGRYLNVTLIVVLGVAVGVLAWRLTTRSGTSVQPPTASASGTHAADKTAVTPAAPAANIPAKSIAVLPFENLSADKKNAYFVAGVRDLILTKLADIGDLKVIARTSTEKYASHPSDLRIIGQQLGVATILEGSVQKAGNQVLINVQLINTKTEAHLWASAYTRTLKNIFGVEGEVAGKIAQALKTELSPTENKRLATSLIANPAANDLYLRAEYFAYRGDIGYATDQWKQALPLYRQAIATAPDFALARSRLSYIESELAWFGGGGEDVKHLVADAREQAEKALKLAPHLPEAHLAVGFSEYWGNGNYAAALQSFAAALKLRPNDAQALAAQGYVERRQGRFDAAINSLKQALAHDPRNTILAAELGLTYVLVSRWADAEAGLRRALALDPTNVPARLWLSNVYLFGHGDIPGALAAAAGDAAQLRLRRVNLLRVQRKYRAALALLDGISHTPDNFNVANDPKALVQANLYRLLGDAPRARKLYAKALPQARTMLATTSVASIEAFVWQAIARADLGLGRTNAALAALAKSRTLIKQAGDPMFGPQLMAFVALAYARAGRADLAVPLLAKALATPGIGAGYAPVMLWLDPVLDPIRDDPRFQALLKKYAQYKPAAGSAPATTSSSS